MTERFCLTVNGAEVVVQADPNTPLLDVLRGELNLKGTRFGCGQGLCGACFVRVDGAVIPACDTPIWSVEHKTVVTVEGLADAGRLHPVQQALLDEQAAQCGYCISGVLVSAATLLDQNPQPDEHAVAQALDGHLCRCGAQHRIVRAVVRAGREQA